MNPVLAAADVATVEKAWASDQGSDRGTWPLMEAAGKAIAREVEGLVSQGVIWVLAGKGNNGGDGYVAAWHLDQMGFDVCVIAPQGSSRPGSDAERARQRWLSVGSEQAVLPETAPVVVVDALLGSGQRGALAEPLAGMVAAVNQQTTYRLAVELMTAAPDASAVSDSAILVLGPGLGRGSQAQACCNALTGRCPSGVLDADGLAWLAAHPRAVPGWVLTPHPGEAGALLGLSAAEVQADRCAAALTLSKLYQAVVVLKGAGSVIAEAGQLWFSHPGTVAMATPGMGDTLAGWIAGLMAQGFSPLQAAQSATWWHAALAQSLASQQRIVLATDLLPLIQAAQPTSPARDH